MTTLRAIGLMSGTSLDGVDVALIDTDGERIEKLGPTGYRAYTPEERELLRAALSDAGRIVNRGDRPGRLVEAEALITRAHAEAVERFVREKGVSVGRCHRVSWTDGVASAAGEIDRADRRRARADPAPECSGGLRFSRRRCSRGGAGRAARADLPPCPRRSARIELPAAVLNIGGVANVTFVAADRHCWHSTRGPVMRSSTTGWASGLGNPSTRMAAPRPAAGPTRRCWRGCCRIPSSAARRRNRSTATGSLIAWSAIRRSKTVLRRWLPLRPARAARALDYAPEPPRRWIVAGGGAKNGELLRLLRHHTGSEIVTADAVGWSSADLEAQAFAYLAVRSLKGLPITFPSTTAVKQPMIGGTIARP